MTRRLAALLLLACPLVAETISFTTEDGVEIVADFHPGKPNAPAVVCLPMFRHDRTTYARLVPPLRSKGFAVCVLDLRGHGASAPGLGKRVVDRDPELFRAMHRDAAAAMRFLETAKGCDGSRFGLVGASVGCSVAVDTTVRHPHRVRAVVLLTPGANYLGVPTLEHLKQWPAAPVFTFCSNEEEATSKPVVDALDRFPYSSFAFFDEKGIHGTRMFGKVSGLEMLIANYMESSMNTLCVQHWDANDPVLSQPGFFGRLHRPRRRVGETTYSLFVWAAGDTWHFGAMVDQPFKGTLALNVGTERHAFPFDTAAKAPKLGGGAEQASFRGKTWIVFRKEGVKVGPRGLPVTVAFRPAKGDEVRIPAGDAPFRAVLSKKK